MRRAFLLLILIFGAVLGAGGILVSLEVNRATSTEAFCTSCHSMVFVGGDPVFLKSAHRTNGAGVHAGCADCHIRRDNWFVETYTHVKSGLRDSIAELTHNYGNATVWEARRVELAHEVRNVMRAENSATCRSCHDAAKISPQSERGQAAHALLREGRMTCIDCHFNIVHAPVPPTLDFIRGSGIGGAAK